MKSKIHYLTILFVLLFSVKQFGQHLSKLTVEVNSKENILSVYQELTFNNQTNDTITSIVLNDWNNAYSDRETPLGNRFSDEFVRSFHMASAKEKGSTNNINIIDDNKSLLLWNRIENKPDLVEIQLKKEILPYQKATYIITYFLKIPDDKFTKYGFNNNGNFTLKNWFLTPTKYVNHDFVEYSNLNIDETPNALLDAELKITIPKDYKISSDLIEIKKDDTTYYFSSKGIYDIPLYIEKKLSFNSYKNNTIEVISNLQDNKLNDINKAIIIDKIVNYVTENLGKNTIKKISVSQADYEKNPFYGFNQLPSFISPFSDDFIFELKFLKTYLNNYLKNSLQLDTRKDNWIFDAIQVYYMMKYIDEYYPDAKMMGNVSKLKLLRGYNLVSLDFNQQYSYFYMLMARKNLDQPLGNSKNTLIKFNEKIASKYRAGLSFKYLAEYMGQKELENSILNFVAFANENQTDESKLISTIKGNSTKDVNWFFDIIINSREIIDYKFENVSKTKETVSFQLNNKTNVSVPIPVYGLKKNEVVFKVWIDNFKADSTYTFKRFDSDKIVINYKNEVPEYNLRNNWKTLKPFKLSNRPIKFNFMRDIEDPFYNQILYVPTIEYNLYDGLILGMRFNNKTFLDKPFVFDINPSLSTITQSFSGKCNFFVNQMNRDSNLFNIKYGLIGNYFHYAADAYYEKINPYVILRIREDDYRDNKRQSIVFRHVYVNKEKSAFIDDDLEGNYAVFNARYNVNKTEITKHFSFNSDVQFSSQFGKLSSEINYRRLLNNNRQINVRFFAGTFLYNNSNTNQFDFGIDRPTDYLFDYEFIGRSESQGIFSQQIIIADAGFKSIFPTRTINQWVASTNVSFNVWNWVEVYGDIGIIKNKLENEKFIYDNGIRLNLVTDYFELYFPVYSNNGWEVTQNNYGEKIRFVITIKPDTLINLFTRKWF